MICGVRKSEDVGDALRGVPGMSPAFLSQREWFGAEVGTTDRHRGRSLQWLKERRIGTDHSSGGVPDPYSD